MRQVVAVFAVVGLLSACGGRSDTLEGDLAAASEIIQVPAAAVEPVALDRYGFTSPNAEATIDVFEVDASLAERFEIFEAPRADPIEFVRNPVSLGALANVLDPSSTRPVTSGSGSTPSSSHSTPPGVWSHRTTPKTRRIVSINSSSSAGPRATSRPRSWRSPLRA